MYTRLFHPKQKHIDTFIAFLYTILKINRLKLQHPIYILPHLRKITRNKYVIQNLLRFMSTHLIIFLFIEGVNITMDTVYVTQKCTLTVCTPNKNTFIILLHFIRNFKNKSTQVTVLHPYPTTLTEK